MFVRALCFLPFVFFTICSAQVRHTALTATSPLIFSETFEDSAAVAVRWTSKQNYLYTNGVTGRGIMIEQFSGGSRLITTPIALEAVRGGAVALAAAVRAENISLPPNSWNGIKVMLKILLADGSALYPQLAAGSGTFDWTTRSLYIAIPDSAVSATLYLGIENCTGRAWFDDVTIRLLKDPKTFPPARDPSLPIERWHSEPALRGTMVSTSIRQSDGEVLGGQWKANLMRWQIGGTSYPLGLQTAGFDSVLQKELTLLDTALVWAKLYNLKVAADLHTLSKGCFASGQAQQRLLDAWKLIAARYKQNSQVWAYDLANEPDPRGGDWTDPSVLIWEDLAEKIAREIRAVDSLKPIVIETIYGDPANFSTLRPIDFSIPRVIYSAHFYLPHAFTHQTLYSYTTPYVYPGVIEGIPWNKAMMEEKLRPVRDFQQKYRVPIFIGEFSAIRWAPSNSAFYYLKDCIDVFESYGWDWCYHAFREYDGWSVEHSETMSDHTPTAVPNDRQNLLRSWFGRNTTGVRADGTACAVAEFTLSQNFPNPFNPSTTISFTLPERSRVSLKIFDVLGREVADLVEEELPAGSHSRQWTAAPFSSGVYFYRMKAGSYTQTRRLVLQK